VIRLLAVACLLVSCIDPQCPPGQGKRGDTCYRLARDAGPADSSDDTSEGSGEWNNPELDSAVSENLCDCRDPARPVCVASDQGCVECTDQDRGACSPNQVCDVASETCVECLQDADCTDPAASVCDAATHECQPCVEGDEDDCSHIEGKHVCFAGECVECTKAALGACTVLQTATRTVQNVCHALTHACVGRQIGKTIPCGECVSDAECWPGHACVPLRHADQPTSDRWYCLPLLDGLNCIAQRPYAVLAPPERTIEGTAVDVCKPALATCEAQNGYEGNCGVDESDRAIAIDDAGAPTQDSVRGDNALCGVPGLDDGFCIKYQPGWHLCTVSCRDVNDCPGHAPACAMLEHASGTRSLCTIRGASL
jgi:hypothetical protein